MKWIVGIVMSWAVCGCASMQSQRTNEVNHVVVCWLKQPGDAGARRQLIDRSYTFLEIPGCRRVVAGPVLPSTRPAVDASFDMAVVMTFSDEQALVSYYTNPIHVRAVEEVLKPLVARYVAYDFTGAAR
ncbi:MAG: Dabb family protein [Tepidisphaeraceae bacterium]